MKMLRFLGVPSNLASRVSGFFASEARIRPYLWDSSSSPACEEFVAGGVVECWYDAGVAFAMDCAVLVVAFASPAMMLSSLAVRASASRASRLRWERSTAETSIIDWMRERSLVVDESTFAGVPALESVVESTFAGVPALETVVGPLMEAVETVVGPLMKAVAKLGSKA
jgi:hypothetical protein